MKHTFSAEIKVNLDLTKEEFDYLYIRCQQHYSYDVTSLAEVGGFMYGWKGQRDFLEKKGKPFFDRELTFRQLDLLCKALEFPMTVESMKMTGDFLKILNVVREKHELINESINQ
jgi:hypothetical protein